MTLKEILSKHKEKHQGIKLHITESKDGKYINIDLIVIPEDLRGQGMGRKIVDSVLEYASIEGKTVCLTPASKSDYKTFGINKKGLEKFWKSGFGKNKDMKFLLNSGKNKDYEISAAMYMEVSKSSKKKTTANSGKKSGPAISNK